MIGKSTRICPVCKQEKPHTEFYHIKTPCMPCHRVRSKKYRQNPSGQEWIRQHSKERYLKFKDKALARAKLKAAVKQGKVIKPIACDRCSRQVALQGHHEDYNKPLEVSWLCDICHKLIHGHIVDSTLIPVKEV